MLCCVLLCSTSDRLNCASFAARDRSDFADRPIGLDQRATSSTARRRGHGKAWHGALLRPVVFDLGSTQRQVALGSLSERLQADGSRGFNQLATSSTWRRRSHDEAGHGALLRPVEFDLGSTQRQVLRCSRPEQLLADYSIGFDQLATSSTRRRPGHDDAGHGSLLRPDVFNLGSTQRQVARDS